MIFKSDFHLLLKCLHFEPMPLITLAYEYVLCIYLFAMIHRDFSTGTGAIVRLHIDWSSSWGFWWENNCNIKPSCNTKKPKMIARWLGYIGIRIGASDNDVFHWNYTRCKWNRTKINKAFSKDNSHTHICTYTVRQLCRITVRVCHFCCV